MFPPIASEPEEAVSVCQACGIDGRVRSLGPRSPMLHLQAEKWRKPGLWVGTPAEWLPVN